MTETIQLPTRRLKTPPLLLVAALLFWGWQSDLLLVGAVMGIILESARVVKARWDLSDTDFRRILNFCTLLRAGGDALRFHRHAGIRRRFSRFVRRGGTRDGNFQPENVHIVFPLAADVFVFVRRGANVQHARNNSDLHDFALAQVAAAQNQRAGGQRECFLSLFHRVPFFRGRPFQRKRRRQLFFWGMCLLIFWALWRFRSRRSGVFIWVLTLALVMILGNFGQHGIGILQRHIANYNAQWLARFMQPRTDPMEITTTMGQIGELKLSGRIVIRLRTKNDEPPPAYLREASYRGYQPVEKSWYSGSRGAISTTTPFHHCTTRRHGCCWPKPTRRRSTSPVISTGGRENGKPAGFAAVAGGQRPAGKPARLRPSKKQRGRGAGRRAGTGDFRRALRPRRDD